ncbi:MAG TPA: DUF1573 domain-containing protein [Candidatus Kapabacteria bacterium]|jgi:hypothetical protein|nr:DUF1573 domain-containing protein [Ignavibacteria bacterium]HRE57311.1 DUF1573 domain-containing protein [Candidatus Kapabacteria bacterium]
MKTLVSIIALVLCMTGLAIAQPQMEIIGGDTHNWGKVKPAQNPLKTTILVRNIGNEELHITQVRPGCGCTTAPLDKDKLKPGDTARIKVELNIGSTNGNLTKSITITSNDSKDRDRIYYLKAEVIRDVQFTPSQFFTFPELRVGETAESKITIRNTSKQPIILSDFELPEGVTLNAKQSITIKEGTSFDLVAKLRPLKKGYYNGEVKMKTSTEDYPTLSLPLYGNVQENTSPVYQK